MAGPISLTILKPAGTYQRYRLERPLTYKYYRPMTKPPRQKVVSIPAARLLGPMMGKIRRLAQTSEKILFSPHALSQMDARGLTDLEVMKALRLGEISGEPWFEPEIGGRGCKVVFRPRGSRMIGVITVVMDADELLLLKTVEWEDRR